MLRRVSLTGFAMAMRPQHGQRPARPAAPLHAEAFTEAGCVLALTLALATVAEYAARARGIS